MFETSRRPHPLHTFRFWFVIVAAGAVTLAWKLDLLPFRFGPADTGRLAPEAFTDVDPVEDSALVSEQEPSSPFYDHDRSLRLPTITSSHQRSAERTDRTDDGLALADMSAPADALPKTSHRPGGTRDDSLLAAQSDPESTSRDAVPRQTAATNPFQFDDDEWPSSAGPQSTGIPQASTQASSATSSAAGEFPSAGDVQQASATTTAFERTNSPADAPVPAAASTAPQKSAGIDFTRIDKLLASGLPADEIDAHRELSTLYWKQPELRDTLRERIDPLAQRIYFLNSRHYMDAYEVQPGDTLQAIARKYDVSWQYLARLNRVDPRRVRAGQRLKVIKGPFSAIVDLSDYELTIHAHGYFVTRYPVGIGKDGSSPIGKFSVLEKLVDPTYYGPEGVIDHDDPANPLGERWIDIGNSYGIHGTIDPASIGKSDSKGCIRLHNDDVEAVYDLLTIGSEVVIRP
jgi:hypothetical protein